ncbi:MAG: pyridoxal-phosphate dependent enzyme [Bacteroidetes bacterium]|nr:pyridoxal-phosphate dependent enzyme [Bacteroidota bacterium]
MKTDSPASSLLGHCLPELLPATRLTPLELAGHRIWLKREDDPWLGGNKLRKASSLIPYLQQQGVPVVALIGGAYSNHVLALAQLLLQYGLTVHAFLRGEPGLAPVGNRHFLRILLPETQCHWVPRSRWAEVHTLATAWAQEVGAALVPEGGFHAAAVPGAATLALDIARNEAAMTQAFAHLWLDAGTGLTAAATLLTDALRCPHRHYHVVLLAEDAHAFRQKLLQVQDWLQRYLGRPVPVPASLHLHLPVWDTRFGKVSAKGTRYLQDFARQYGILLDPVYTLKLLATAEQWIATQADPGQVLVVHSGGQPALSGFKFPATG